MSIENKLLIQILEGALMVAGHPLTATDLLKLFPENETDVTEIREALATLQAQYQDRGIELLEVANGFKFQAKSQLSPWLIKLWDEKPPRYSRALLETLALIAYRQPITRAEIEDIRGVSASSHILKTLQDREWIRVIGYKDTPGKPALYATTKTFLDHLGLKNLQSLPALADLKDLDSQAAKLQLELSNVQLELSTEDTNPDNPHSELSEN